MPISTALTILLLNLPIAISDEHHEDKIPEGQAVSVDPIVRLSFVPGSPRSDILVGLNSMDSHRHTDTCVWGDLPHRYGLGYCEIKMACPITDCWRSHCNPRLLSWARPRGTSVQT